VGNDALFGVASLKQISAYTLDKFIEAVRKGAIIHNIDIIRWTLQAQQLENL